MKKLLTTLLFAAVMAISYHANAVTATYTLAGGIDCDDPLISTCWDGVPGVAPDYLNINNNFNAANISAITGVGVLYETFKNESPYDADLVFNVGTSADFFYVKDGSNDPKWYIFDLRPMSDNVWDGTITLTGTWFGKPKETIEGIDGPISHVTGVEKNEVVRPNITSYWMWFIRF